MTRIHTSLLLAGLVLVAGCPADDDGADELTVVTFNAGLAFGYVEEASARVDPIIAAVNDVDADVVCLQELWVEQDGSGNWNSTVLESVLGGLSNFPNTYWSRTTPRDDVEPTGCSIEESEPLEVCAMAACGDEDPDNLADCVLVNCGDEFQSTSAGCQMCLVANLGETLETIIGACKGVVASGVAYDGHNGLAIASRLPLSNTEIRELEYVLTARAILHGQVETEGGTAVDLYCTHLASDLSASGLNYPEDAAYSSFAEENRAQAQEVVSWAEDASGDAVILLGDFNHGPSVGGGRAELKENYDLVIEAGFSDPVAEIGEPCSFCDSNLLLDGMGSSGELIDHVYVDDQAKVESTEIVLNAPVKVTGAGGSEIDVHLSDHFGVRTVLSY